MDTLLNPDSGLIIWTIISFLVLVVLMKSFAWGPLVGAIEARESHMREERERAEKARQGAEKIRGDLDRRLAGAETEASDILARAGREGEAVRSALKKEAEEESRRLIRKARAQLEEEKRRLIGELRGEVASLSVDAAERLMSKSVDPGVRKSVLDRFFTELDKKGRQP